MDQQNTFITIPFSRPTMYDHLHYSADEGTTKYPKGISASISPPGFPSHPTAVRDKRWLADLFNFMTNEEDVTISELDIAELQRMASLLTSNSDYFLAIVGDKFGSRRVQKFLGKSDPVDALFCAAIVRCFLPIMTDKYSSRVAIRAMIAFDREKKMTMYEQILFYALDIACDKHGCIALNDIITDSDDQYYRDSILEFVAHNALFLSNDDSGNYVVQHVLKLNNLRCTFMITFSLNGHFVELSFKKYGSYVVEKLMEAKEQSMVAVVVELLECNVDTLIRLARNEFGNFVVGKALKLTWKMSTIDLFGGLVQKLMPFLHLLRSSHGRNIATILNTFKFRK